MERTDSESFLICDTRVLPTSPLLPTSPSLVRSSQIVFEIRTGGGGDREGRWGGNHVPFLKTPRSRPIEDP